MTQPSMSLMDILSPPGNRWLSELSRRAGELPVGVRIVRFGAGDDDPADEEPPASSPAAKHRKPRRR